MSVSLLRFDMCRSGLILTLIAVLVFGLSLTACHEEKPSQETQVDETLAKTYLSIIQEMTELMSEPGDGAMHLERIRVYVQSNAGRLKEATNAIKQGVLNLDETKRDAMLAETTPKIDAALERFARAQIALRAKMTESEQWELGEALGMLR